MPRLSTISSAFRKVLGGQKTGTDEGTRAGGTTVDIAGSTKGALLPMVGTAYEGSGHTHDAQGPPKVILFSLDPQESWTGYPARPKTESIFVDEGFGEQIREKVEKAVKRVLEDTLYHRSTVEGSSSAWSDFQYLGRIAREGILKSLETLNISRDRCEVWPVFPSVPDTTHPDLNERMSKGLSLFKDHAITHAKSGQADKSNADNSWLEGIKGCVLFDNSTWRVWQESHGGKSNSSIRSLIHDLRSAFPSKDDSFTQELKAIAATRRKWDEEGIQIVP